MERAFPAVRRKFLLVVVAVAVAGGCALLEPASRIRDTPASDAVPPLARLGRWDGRQFAPVAPGSVNPGLVTVLVHGWGHGLAPAVLTDRDGPLPLVWDDALRASHRDFYQAMWDLAAVLGTRDPQTVVLAYSWIDDSATSNDPLDARISRVRAPRNGARLADALRQAVAPGFDFEDLHFVAHSHGGLVAASAALALPRMAGQLTLLDPPEDAMARDERAAADLAPLLARMKPSRTRPPFVENYISEFGAPYHTARGLEDVVDVRLHPPPHLDMSARHKYAVVWYTESARQPEKKVGHWWNRWVGAPLDQLQSAYAQVPAGTDVSLNLTVVRTR